MDEIHILDCNDNEKIYRVALESFSYVPDEVDTIIKELQGFGYIDNENEITPNGTNYLKHNTIKEKQRKLVGGVTSKKIRVNWHDAETSFLEGVFARGDRRLSSVIYAAWKNGCKLDGWGEYFDYQKWQNAFDECNIDPKFYNCRKRDFDEVLPWSHLDYGISEKFLKNENIKAHNEATTPHCREKCAGCGANRLGQCKN